MDPLLNSLTPAQQEAVTHLDGPMLILAGPGSGKTRVVTHRIAYMLRSGVSPHQIVALTFTNKAADEMRMRLQLLAPGKPVWMGTFHRFCSRLLRRCAQQVGLGENFTIYDTGDSLRCLKLALEELDLDLTHFTPERIAQAISWAKNDLMLPEEYVPRPGSPIGAIVQKAYPVYQRRLLESNAVDFDDLLLHTVTLLRDSPELREELDERWKYILVDEYQDTNRAQYVIVRSLSVRQPNLAVTGDPDQSIYGWRGANLNNILDFEKDYPDVHVVRLEKNYRSTKSILRAADALISCNKRRKEKALFTDNGEGRPVRLAMYGTHRNEADGIVERIVADIAASRRRPRDFAIFYRTNALSRTIEESLREHGVPYQVCNGIEFYQRKEIKDIVAYLQLINNPRDDVALLRIINTPPRGVGATTITRLRDHARREGISLWEAACRIDKIGAISGRSATAVKRFVEMFIGLQSAATAAVEEILGRVMVQSGYRAWLAESEAPEDQERLANIEELLTVAREYDERHPEEDAPLESFLEQAALVNDTDNLEEGSDRVSLMTLHGSKGLEFPSVFIIACEERILPHELSREDPDKLEEERRLLFVGLTRAQEELQLSLAQTRTFRGERRAAIPSSFLMELPRAEMEIVEPDWTPLEDSGHDEAWEEPVFQDEFIEERLLGSSSGSSNGQAANDLAKRLAIAAEMLSSDAASSSSAATPVSPDAFHLGMTVIHPEYGLGKIAALSGSGIKRTATVFFVSAGEKKFRLSHSPLRPVGG